MEDHHNPELVVARVEETKLWPEDLVPQRSVVKKVLNPTVTDNFA